MAIWKIAPALITGHSVILKPAEQSPMSAIPIGALLSEAGVPDGVFSVLPGDDLEVVGLFVFIRRWIVLHLQVLERLESLCYSTLDNQI